MVDSSKTAVNGWHHSKCDEYSRVSFKSIYIKQLEESISLIQEQLELSHTKHGEEALENVAARREYITRQFNKKMQETRAKHTVETGRVYSRGEKERKATAGGFNSVLFSKNSKIPESSALLVP